MTTRLSASTILNLTAFALAGAVLASCGPAQKPVAPHVSPALAWAYPTGPNGATPQPLPEGPQTVPGSVRTFTIAQVNDDRNPPDWFPNEHPPAPPIVAHGTKDGPTPCAECHLMNGQGFPGAANLNGLPAAYIIAQVHAFKNGDRRSSQADRSDTAEMIKVAQAVSEPDLNAAAAYFSALPPRPFVRVVESATVPATRGDYYGWLDLVPEGAPEPIAGRIIEVSEDTVNAFRSDPHVGIVDYAPPGAIARGAANVRSGGSGGEACRSCHGFELHGAGAAPPLAGRAPTYLARMLWDIKTGARHGGATGQMQAPAQGLNEAQITDVAAYLGSLKP